MNLRSWKAKENEGCINKLFLIVLSSWYFYWVDCSNNFGWISNLFLMNLSDAEMRIGELDFNWYVYMILGGFDPFLGKCSIWDGCAWWLQAQVLGLEGKKSLPLHCFQDWGEAKAGCSGKGWWIIPELRGFHCKPSCRWMPICCLRLWLRDWRELPEKQDYFHCLVMVNGFWVYSSLKIP